MGMVEDIHNSDIYGVFVELGAGVPLASKLFDVEGASKTVATSMSPYAKETSSEMFGDNRAVSFEGVLNAVSTSMIDEEEQINTFFISSFQLGKDICNHGWIVLKYKDTEKYYHITIPHHLMKFYGRKWVISQVGDISLRILHSKNEPAHIPFCDMIRTNSGFFNREECLDNLLQSTDGFLTFTPGYQMCRLEEVLRGFGDDTPIIYKGSFNPPTKAHDKNAKLTEETLGHKPIFMISTETYKKDPIATADVIRRVNILNKLGYTVVVTRSGYYNENITRLRMDRNFLDQLMFVVGGDTLKKLVDLTDLTEPQPLIDVDYFCIKRPGVEIPDFTPLNVLVEEAVFKVDISSTMVREAFKEGDMETLKGLLPYDPKEW